MLTARKEPKITGRCAQCGKPVDIKPRSGVNPALYMDPFCTSVCAKAYFHVGDEERVTPTTSR